MARRILPLLLFSLFFCSAAFAQTADLTTAILAPETADSTSPIFWSIDVINNGPADARNVSVSVSADPPLNTSCDTSHIDIIYGDGRANVHCFTAALGAAGTVTLHANVVYATDPNPLNNTATRPVQVIAGPNLAVNVGAVTPIVPGLPFDISVHWNDLSKTIPATNVTIGVTLPAGVQATHIPDNCTLTGPQIACTIGTVAPTQGGVGEWPNLTITAIADDSTNGQTLNLVADIAGSETEGDRENNHATYAALVYRTFFITDTAGDRLPNAVDAANHECTDGYPCKIAFRLDSPPASGYFTIKPSRAMAPITGYSVSIDGTTQTRYGGDTNPDGPEIFIDGSEAGAPDAIVFDEPCVAEVSSLAIGNYPNTAITIHGKFGSQGLPAPCKTYGRSIHDNYLGVDPTGTHAAPNERGIVFDETLYSFATSVERNVISGNRRSGVWIGVASLNRIAGNRIGVDIHNQPLGNGASGIFVGPRANDVDIRGNYIAFNHDFGIAVAREAIGTDIGPNSIFANWQIGIDVGLDGPTPKSGVPAPDILSAQYDPATDTTVVVAATSEHATLMNPTLILYASDAPHPSGYGDGQYLIGIVARFDPRQGNITFAAKGDWRGKWVSGTVTRNQYYGFLTAAPAPTSEFPDTHSTTSEFGRAVRVE